MKEDNGEEKKVLKKKNIQAFIVCKILYLCTLSKETIVNNKIVKYN